MKSEQEAQEEEKQGQVKSEQEAQEEEKQGQVKSEQEAQEEEKRGQVKSEQEEQEEEKQGQVKSEQEAREERVDAQGERGRKEGEMKDANSLQEEESHVSNRHMTWWQNGWWVRVNNGPHVRTARGRRRIWRAARQAAEQACHEEWVGETRGEEGERDRRRRDGRKGERHQVQLRQRRQQQLVAIEVVVRPVHPATGASMPDEHVTAVEGKPKLHLDFCQRDVAKNMQ